MLASEVGCSLLKEWASAPIAWTVLALDQSHVPAGLQATLLVLSLSFSHCEFAMTPSKLCDHDGRMLLRDHHYHLPKVLCGPQLFVGTPQ